jgi:hypothetical protein
MTSNETGRVDECKALVRAILRILRVFSDWIASDAENELTDAAELSNKERQPQPRIAGIQEQEYHTVELNGIGSYWVIKYDVASRPVSFHHPLHWLLAGLLENIGLLEDGILAEAGWNASFVDLIRGTDQCRFSNTLFEPLCSFPKYEPVYGFEMATVCATKLIITARYRYERTHLTPMSFWCNLGSLWSILIFFLPRSSIGSS